MASASVQNGTGSFSDAGVTVDTNGNVDLSGLVDNVMHYLDVHAPKFVVEMTNVAAGILETEAAVETAVSSAVAALPAEVSASLAAAAGTTVGGVVAAAAAFAPVAAAVLAVPVVLYAVVGTASGGTGTCGVAPYTRARAIAALTELHNEAENVFGRGGSSFYVPSEADIQNLMLYSGVDADSPPNPGEWQYGHYNTSPGADSFINATLVSAYNKSNGCWSYMAPAEWVVAFSTALGVWNRTHAAQRTINVNGKSVTLGPTFHSRMVNATVDTSFGGKPWTRTGVAVADGDGSVEPIEQALNYAAMGFEGGKPTGKWLVKPNSLVTYYTNDGPPLSKAQIAANAGLANAAHLLKIKMAPPKPPPTSGRSVGRVGFTAEEIAKASANLVVVKPAVSATHPASVAVPAAWYDRQESLLAGATPKQAAITGGAIGAITWLLKALVRS